jgi:D-cysteine desulfhydrase
LRSVVTNPPRALVDIWPSLAFRLPWLSLGQFPTPVTELAELSRALELPPGLLFEKRDDVSASAYGGNKVRTLEVLFGAAVAAGATAVFSTGAFGSNHALATVLHAPRVGLRPGVILFPQPRSWAALENLRGILSAHPSALFLPHWSCLPFGMAYAWAAERRRGQRPYIMVPGGATPLGALGYVSAAFELAVQVDKGELPPPRTIVVGVGSTCTSAGLLVGLCHAARLGVGFRDRAGRPLPPRLVSARVTPWPVTSKHRIVGLAERASRLLAELCGEPELSLHAEELAANLEVTGEALGKGYGQATPAGRRALGLWREHVGHALDTTYSAKAAAVFLARSQRNAEGPVLLWATKSSVSLPNVAPDAIEGAPGLARRWMQRAERELAQSGELPSGLVTALEDR